MYDVVRPDARPLLGRDEAERIRAGIDDPDYSRMLHAATGDCATWRAVNAAMRDAMVEFARRRCPFYARTLAPGVPFERLPLVTKQHLRDHQSDIFPTGWDVRELSAYQTSGSTGDPLVFYREPASFKVDDAAQTFLQRWHDSRHGMLVAIRARRHRSPSRPPAVHDVDAIELTAELIASELARWAQWPTYSIYGYASAIEFFAHVIERDGLVLKHKPRAVVTTSDMLTETGAGLISRVFGAPMHCWYGSHEFSGFLGGTIPGTRRYALNPCIAYVEVTDDLGRPLPAGQVGKLVLTHLNNYGFPFIRYDTGDRAAMSATQDFGGFFVLESLQGRSSECLVLPNGKFLSPPQVGQWIIAESGAAAAVRFYQCALVADDRFEVRIVWVSGEDAHSRRSIADAARELCGADIEVTVRSVDRLEFLGSGKRWILRDERGRESRGVGLQPRI